MKHIYIILVMGFMLSFSVPLVNAKDEINWVPYQEGMETAKSDQKNIFIFFSNITCKYCEKMKKYAFQKKEVITFLNDHYISIIVDTLEQKDVAKKYGVRPIPVSLFLDPEGNQIKRSMGYLTPSSFLNKIEKIHENHSPEG